MSFGDEPLGSTPHGSDSSEIVTAFKAIWAKCATIINTLKGLS